MEDTQFSELTVDVHMRINGTRIMITIGTQPAASATTSSYCITNDPIFGLESEIDEDIATDDALDIYRDGGYIDVEG